MRYALKHMPRQEAYEELRKRVKHLLSTDSIPVEIEEKLNYVLGEQPNRYKIKALSDLIWEFR